jgi:hypothetical protein
MPRIEYDKKTWDQIKQEWVSGQLSLAEISRSYGPTKPGIRKHARSSGWPARGTLAEEVRREINTALVTDQDPGQVSAEVPPLETDEIIEGAARRGLAVVRAHRGLFKRTLDQAAETLSEVEEMQGIKLELILKERLKGRSKLVSAIIGNRIDALEAVSRILARVVPLERKAYSLDSEKGEITSIKYVTPDMDKPEGTGLSQDEWSEDHGQDGYGYTE